MIRRSEAFFLSEVNKGPLHLLFRQSKNQCFQRRHMKWSKIKNSTQKESKSKVPSSVSRFRLTTKFSIHFYSSEQSLYSDQFHAMLTLSCGPSKCQCCIATVTYFLCKIRFTLDTYVKPLLRTSNQEVFLLSFVSPINQQSQEFVIRSFSSKTQYCVAHIFTI